MNVEYVCRFFYSHWPRESQFFKLMQQKKSQMSVLLKDII